MSNESNDLSFMQSTIAFFIDTMRDASLDSIDESGLQLAAESPKYKIKVAATSAERKPAHMLIDRMYSGRGYETRGALDHEPNKMTLVAYSNDKAVGTLSVRKDSFLGLFADEMYHEELNDLRKSGCRICEFTGLAIDPEIKSKGLLASMIHVAYLYHFRILGITDGVLEVNPRHVKFYESMLDLDRIGPERMCLRANAPSVLLRANFPYMAEQIRKYGGFAAKPLGRKSLYPYFFPYEMESLIISRMSSC